MKKVVDLDLTKFDEVTRIWEQMKDHPQTTTKAEELYFDLIAKLFRDIRTAYDEGRPWVAFMMSVPAEVFVALDVPCIEYDMSCPMSSIFLDKVEEVNKAAFALGTRPEVCSPQRAPIGWFAKGWFPRPSAVIISNLDQCDNMAQTGNVLGKLYDVPTFFLNRPYRWRSERGIQMMVGEIEDLIAFMEELTSRKMDRDKLEEAVRNTVRMFELSFEIRKLAMATPCPLKGGTGFILHWIRYAYGGRPEGVSYCETFRDELKEKVARGEGVAPVEKLRLMSLFTPPAGQHDLHHWLEKERGAPLVSEPYDFVYDEEAMDKVDPAKPVEALARMYYIEPYYRFYGPLEQYLEMILKDAIEGKVDGALNWFNAKCRMGGSGIKVVKDMLLEKAGVPTLTVDFDILDCTESEGERLKDLIGQFLDMLESAKKN